MASEQRQPATPDWFQIEALVATIGEDPGRYLDGPLDPLARIRGLNTVHEVNAWRAAERKLATHRNRSPRSAIMDALDEREVELEEHGEFDPDRQDTDIVLGVTSAVLGEIRGDSVHPGSSVTPIDEPTFEETRDEFGVRCVWDPERVLAKYTDSESEDPTSERTTRAVADGGDERGE